MNAPVGGLVEPAPCGRADVGEVPEVATGQEVLFHIAYGVLNAAFFLRAARITGYDPEAVVGCEGCVAGIPAGCFTDFVLEHGRLEIVDHDRLRHPVKVLEGVLMTAKKVLLLL